MQSLCVSLWVCGCVSTALASFLHQLITSFRITSHHTSYRISNMRIGHGVDLRKMLRRNENVLRHKISFEKYMLLHQPCHKRRDLFSEAWIFFRSMGIFTKYGSFSFRSMKRREGVFSPKAQKWYVCKVSCIVKK
jgi:hypothetical protein